MPDDPEQPAFSRPLALRRLNPGQPFAFDDRAGAEELASIALALGVETVRKFRFAGALRPSGPDGWALDAQLGVTAVQACVVTLAPVTTRLDVAVRRRYVPGGTPPADGAEVGPDDDLDTEALPTTLDLGAIALEETALALPDYPRADGADPRRCGQPGRDARKAFCSPGRFEKENGRRPGSRLRNPLRPNTIRLLSASLSRCDFLGTCAAWTPAARHWIWTARGGAPWQDWAGPAAP